MHRLNDYVDMEELGGDDLRAEGRLLGLEHHAHHAVANPGLAGALLAVSLGVGQAGEHVELEHHLVPLPDVEAEAVILGVMQILAQKPDELVELLAVTHVTEYVLLAGLAGPLVQNSKCVFVSFEQLVVIIIIGE